MGGDNACILLEKGEHEVILPDAVFSAACGLLPMGGPLSLRISPLCCTVLEHSCRRC